MSDKVPGSSTEPADLCFGEFGCSVSSYRLAIRPKSPQPCSDALLSCHAGAIFTLAHRAFDRMRKGVGKPILVPVALLLDRSGDDVWNFFLQDLALSCEGQFIAKMLRVLFREGSALRPAERPSRAKP